jgi:hypothetical protein
MEARRAGRRRLLSIAGLSILVLLAGCAPGGGGATASPSTPGTPSPAPSGSAAAEPVDSPEEAAERVFAEDPDTFDGLDELDPDLIGQCCWYEAREVEGGYEVKIEIGWGDCIAGCINKHRWIYAVAPTGEVALIDEAGPSLEPGAVGN